MFAGAHRPIYPLVPSHLYTILLQRRFLKHVQPVVQGLQSLTMTTAAPDVNPMFRNTMSGLEALWNLI